jgi:protein-L-isoaspartate(D-aspartate) O-methyltransferase|tara:strand:+ start:606 stop:1247 length:642 start_codon:yes stop_codon:yes gene_type:complete
LRDSSKHKGLRKRLVDQLVLKGIKSKIVIDALLKVPRHLFIDQDFETHAYIDKAFPIDSEQTISQPFTVAFQTSLLNLNKKDKVLEIGTGSGYQTAILMEIADSVFSIERQHKLYRRSKKNLTNLGYKTINIKYGDGYKGLQEHQPFDKILVTAGAEILPKQLLLQLKIGGKLVIPIGKDIQKMTVIERKSEKSFDKKIYGNFKFVPMLKNTN